jgi:hypothetical protein
VEPKYPYIVERYLDLGRFCDGDLISDSTGDTIKRLIPEYKSKYVSVYRCIKAARFITDDLFGTVFDMDVVEKVKKRAAGIIKREITSRKSKSSPAEAKQGKEIRRFLSGMTPKGNILLTETVHDLCDRVYEIIDSYGYCHFMLAPIRNAAVSAGYDVFSCYCPMNPDIKIDHLIIPELSLGFVTVHSDFPCVSSPYRRIHIDAYIPSHLLRNNRQKLKFMRRTCASLLDEATDGLRTAKALHDRIEALYNPAIDYNAIYSYADELGERLLKRYLHLSSRHEQI